MSSTPIDSAKIRGHVGGEPIPQCLQHGAKQTERTMVVLPSQACVEVVYPSVRKLNGMLDAF
jgi:hypothetical protein